MHVAKKEERASVIEAREDDTNDDDDDDDEEERRSGCDIIVQDATCRVRFTPSRRRTRTPFEVRSDRHCSFWTRTPCGSFGTSPATLKNVQLKRGRFGVVSFRRSGRRAAHRFRRRTGR